MAAQEPATKQDLEILGAELRSEIATLRSEMLEKMEQLVEQMRDMQTELLKAFLPWQLKAES